MPIPEPQDTSLVTVIHIDRAAPQGTAPPAGPQDTSAPTRPRDTATGPAPVNVEIDLEPGITVHKEPDLGMPFVVIESGRVRLNLGVNAGQATELTSGHLALVDQLAEGFIWLRDQVRNVAPATAASPDTATS